MYDFEKRRVKDGEPAFGLEGTFRIHSTIYVLSAEADERVLHELARHDYKVKGEVNSLSYFAEKRYEINSHEIYDDLGSQSTFEPTSLIINMNYADGHKHSLTEPDIHETIIRAAGQVSHLEWFSRTHDRYEPVITDRMTAFAQNLVDVNVERWHAFLLQSQNCHAQDFIRSMAAWTSRHSNNLPREVRVDSKGFSKETIYPQNRYFPRSYGYHLRME